MTDGMIEFDVVHRRYRNNAIVWLCTVVSNAMGWMIRTLIDCMIVAGVTAWWISREVAKR